MLLTVLALLVAPSQAQPCDEDHDRFAPPSVCAALAMGADEAYAAWLRPGMAPLDSDRVVLVRRDGRRWSVDVRGYRWDTSRPHSTAETRSVSVPLSRAEGRAIAALFTEEAKARLAAVPYLPADMICLDGASLIVEWSLDGGVASGHQHTCTDSVTAINEVAARFRELALAKDDRLTGYLQGLERTAFQPRLVPAR